MVASPVIKMTSKITRQDCEKLLKDLNLPEKHELLEFTLEPFCKETRGYLGEHLLLTLIAKTKEGTTNFTFFVKHVTTDGFLQCFEDIGFFEKEVYAYQFIDEAKKLVPDIDVSVVPKLYLVKDNLMVFENLATTGYEGPKTLRLNHLEVQKVLESMAKFHAISIAYENHKSRTLGKKYKITDDHNGPEMHRFFTKSLSSGRDDALCSKDGAHVLIDILHPEEKRVALKKKLDERLDEFFDVLNDPNNLCNVFCHADLWAFNFVFKHMNGIPEHCKFVDFQMFRYAPPAHDVTMMIYCVTSEETRRKYIPKFYNHYYECLRQELQRLDINIADVLPKSEYQRTLKVFMRVAKLIWLIYRQLSQANPETIKRLFENADIQKAVICGDKRPEFVKEHFNNDPNYRNFITEIWLNVAQTFDDSYVCIDDIYEIIPQDIQSTDYEVLNYRLENLSAMTGFLGNHQRLLVEIKHENEIKTFKYFSKAFPLIDDFQKFTIVNGCALKEMEFYGKIVQDFLKEGIEEIKDVIPKLYLTQFDLLILEDLEMKGYEIAQVRHPMDFERAKLGLISLAKLHACGLIYEEIMTKELCFPVRLNELYQNEFQEAFYNESSESKNLLKAGKLGIIKAIELSDPNSNPLTLQQLQSMAVDSIDNYKNLVKPSTSFRNTLCHGDIWGSNLMYSSTDVKIVDFQSYRYCPPTHDLAQFLYLNFHREDRLKYSEALKDFYFEHLKNVLHKYNIDINDIIPKEDFDKSYMEETRFACLQNTTHFQTIMTSSDNMKEFFSDAKMAKKYMFEDRSEHVTNNYASDPLYKKRIVDAITDLKALAESYSL